MIMLNKVIERSKLMQSTFYFRKYFICFFNFFQEELGNKLKTFTTLAQFRRGCYLPSFLFPSVKKCPPPSQEKNDSELYGSMKLSHALFSYWSLQELTRGSYKAKYITKVLRISFRWIYKEEISIKRHTKFLKLLYSFSFFP